MRGDEKGLALVQVMVMSVVLILFATGVLEMIFSTHILYSKTKTSAENKSWVEACMAQKTYEWRTGTTQPCNGSSTDSCTFPSGSTSITVNIKCQSSGEVTFSLQ